MPSSQSLKNLGVTAATAPFVKLAVRRGFYQHVVAAYLNDNQGRVSETITGKRHSDAPLADDLPFDFPLAA